MSQQRFVFRQGQNVPDHWYENSWEEKAKENPLYAVMTTPNLLDADSESFSEEHLRPFFEKGRVVFASHVQPRIEQAGFPAEETFIVEYGCGVGRVLKAIVEAGLPCAGIDIAPTMLRHCARLVPGVRSLSGLDADGRSELSDGCATTVFSFAVLKHISRLSEDSRAVAEICRLLRPGGTLALNVNTQDFLGGNLRKPERTVNEETRSLHFHRWRLKPYRQRKYTTWSGVHIGIRTLRRLLAAGGVKVLELYYHDPKKLKGIWVVGRKRR